MVYWFDGIADPRLEKLGSGYVTIFSTDFVIHHHIIERTSLGFAHAYRMRSEHAEEVRAWFQNIDGESITLVGMAKSDVLAQLPHHHVISCSPFGTMLYSNRAQTFIRDGNNRINMQVVDRGDRVIVGWPVILGSF